MLNKKGGSLLSLFILTAATMVIIFIGIFAGILPLLDNYYIDARLSTDYLEYDVKSTLLLDSADCLAYKDDSGKVHPGVIDLDKLPHDTKSKMEIFNCLGFKQDTDVELTDPSTWLENHDWDTNADYYLILEEIDGDRLIHIYEYKKENYDDEQEREIEDKEYIEHSYLVRMYVEDEYKTGRMIFGLKK